jgi:hypothetical protein
MLQARSIREKPLKFLKWFGDMSGLARFWSDRSVRDALFVFVLTRSLIFMIFVFVGHLNVITLPDQPTNIREAFISFEGAPVARRLRETMWRADVAHYMVIAREGYLNKPQEVATAQSRGFAFFPLFPLVLWLLGRVTSDVMLAGAALSNLFFFCGLVLLHKLTLAFGYDTRMARRTIFYLACFPVSYFFSVPLTESLFLLLTVGSFYAAKQERWWIAGTVGALASATRVNGVILLPALLVLSWQQYRAPQVKKVLGVRLVPLGLAAYMFYSWWRVGNAWAFKDSVALWGRKTTFFLTPLVKYVIHPHKVVEPWNFNLLNAAAALLSFWAVYFLIRRREWALAVFVLLSVTLALSSGILQSLDRYALGFFPIFMALGIAVRSYNVDQAIRFIFVILLGVMAVLFAANFTIAVS